MRCRPVWLQSAQSRPRCRHSRGRRQGERMQGGDKMPHSIFPIHRAGQAVLAVAILALAQSAAAQSYPSRPVRMLHGFSAGTNVDIISRLMATEMTKILGQTVLVEAQPGAGSTIAAATVARAKPDGYTLLMTTGSH